jgi:hypothetical protein
MKHKEGGKSISGWAYIIIGIGVSVYSHIVRTANPEHGAMTLFFYLGIIFAAVGAGKILLGRKNKEATIAERRVEDDYTRKLQQQQRLWREHVQREERTPAQHSIIGCPKCNARNYSTANYCYQCGTQLR